MLVNLVVKYRDVISLRRGYCDNCALSSYACSDSLLLTPLCYDNIHKVTPRVSALAGCDNTATQVDDNSSSEGNVPSNENVFDNQPTHTIYIDRDQPSIRRSSRPSKLNDFVID
ncbi:hypothetical protein Tco_1308640, partial [Tanacetum coccineum]